MTTESDDAAEALTPGIEGVEADEEASNPKDLAGNLLPDDSDTDNDGRTGFLSTYVEWHALVIGIAVGTVALRTGQFELIMAIVGAGAVGSRAQLGLPEKYLDQAKSELPYFIAGVVIAFVGTQLTEMGFVPA